MLDIASVTATAAAAQTQTAHSKQKGEYSKVIQEAHLLTHILFVLVNYQAHSISGESKYDE